MASKEVRLAIRRMGTMGFDIVIAVDENPSSQDDAMELFDKLIFKEGNLTWLTYIAPWRVNYQVGISARSFFADTKNAKSLLEQWIKACETKFEKKHLTVNGFQ